MMATVKGSTTQETLKLLAFVYSFELYLMLTTYYSKLANSANT